MRNFLSRFSLKENSLHGAGILFLIGQTIASILNYAYHLIMGRLLGPQDYGVLATLFSIIYIVSYASTTITLTVSKYSAGSVKQKGRLKRILHDSSLIFIPLSAILLLICAVFSKPLSDFLVIDNALLLLVIFTSLLIIIFSLLYGFLNGLNMFSWQNAVNVFIAFIKLLLGALLVLLGFGVSGSLMGMLIGYAVIIVLIVVKLRKIIFHSDMPGLKTSGIVKTSIIIFLTITLLTLLMSIDQILVKHFFTEFDAGIYAAATTISKTIFFGSSFFIFILFPKVVEAKKDQKEQKKILLTICGYSLVMISIILLILLAFPKQMILIMYGENYLESASIVVLASFATLFYSFIFIIAHFNLARDNVTQIIVLFSALLLEIGFISLIHGSLSQVLYIIITINFLALVLVSFIAFSFRNKTGSIINQ